MSSDPPAFQEDEKEIKLRVRKAHLPRLSRHRLVQSSAKAPPRKERLVSVYYDTPDHRLYAHGLTLRVRRDRGGLNFQTMKGSLAADGLTRQEWHRQVTELRPQLDGFPTPEFNRKLRTIIGERPLCPVFTTDVERTAWMLELPQGDRVELALDVGKLTAGGRKMPLCEAELELKSGDGARLFDIAQALRETVPFEVASESKSTRGYRLASGAAPAPVKAAAIEFAADASAPQAFKAIARNCLDQLAANEAGAKLGHDAEYVHQMRVALRRLHTAVRLFAPIIPATGAFDLAGETRWLARQLGPARDWDVFIAETLMPLIKQHPRETGLRQLAVAARGQRRQAYEAARAALREPRYTAFQLGLGQWLAGPDGETQGDGVAAGTPSRPAAEFANEVLATQWKKVKALARSHESLSIEEWHRLRIRAKRLRYSVDFFRSFYDRKETKRLYDGLGEMQDRLGALNDADTGRKLLAAATAAVSAEKQAGARAQGKDDTSLPRVQALVDGWYTARATLPPEGFDRLWKRLAARPPKWRRAKRARPAPDRTN